MWLNNDPNLGQAQIARGRFEQRPAYGQHPGIFEELAPSGSGSAEHCLCDLEVRMSRPNLRQTLSNQLQLRVLAWVTSSAQN